MEDMFLYMLLLLPFLLLACSSLLRRTTQHRNLPPSPPALPIIGHLHLLKLPLHRPLYALSKKYGPIISLRFGSRRVMVVSSSSSVKEFFTKNDVVISNRPPLTIFKHVNYNASTLGTSQYGEHWRNLRRISTLEIFSSNRLNVLSGTRKDEIKILLNKLYNVSSHDFAKVKLKPMLEELNFNVILRMVAGKRYYGEQVTEKDMVEAKKFREIIREMFVYTGASYLGDYFPFLKWIDYQGFIKRATRLGDKTDRFLQSLIDEHRRHDMAGSESRNDTMVSHLLAMQQSQPEYYTDEIIKGLILDVTFAATDSSALTIEWALSNLLNHPELLEKAKNELDLKVGDKRLIEESDISKLPFLQNIISETVRLHPAGPLLIRYASEGFSVEGYHVEPGTIVIVNVWAVHRDPKFWDDATEFKPERFESSTGQGSEAYNYFPFGLGRRSCPGSGLAHRVVGLTLGSLIQCFEWKRPSDEKIDITEAHGLSMPKAKPLEAMCKARNITANVMSSSL